LGSDLSGTVGTWGKGWGEPGEKEEGVGGRAQGKKGDIATGNRPMELQVNKRGTSKKEADGQSIYRKN